MPAKKQRCVQETAVGEKADGAADDKDEEEEDEEEEEEGEEEESSDGDSELSLQVDEDGRVCSQQGVLTRSICLDPPVRVFDGLIPSPSVATLRTCCEQCFKAKPSRGRYSAGKTFWVEASQAPRCELEALALAILRKHCPEPAAAAGVEWWTLCLDSDADVGWHWDRDYVLEDSGVNIHPMLSTVTYLSEPSQRPHVSTMVLDVTSPPARDPANLVSLPKTGSSVSCTVVPPCTGRHLVFDGRFLHGAPKRHMSSTVEPSSKRITFLANIWVGHKPSNASALPSDLQVWSVSGEKLAAWRKLEAILEAAPTVAVPVEAAVDAAHTASFPLEGGTLKVTLPMVPPDAGPLVVQAALVNASWALKQAKGKKRRRQ